MYQDVDFTGKNLTPAQGPNEALNDALHREAFGIFIMTVGLAIAF